MQTGINKLKHCISTDRCEFFQSIVSKKCLTREREQAVSSELTLEQYLLSLQQPKRKKVYLVSSSVI